MINNIVLVGRTTKSDRIKAKQKRDKLCAIYLSRESPL